MATITEKQTALKNWLVAVSGLTPGKVILRDSGGPAPTGDYIVFDAPVKYQNIGTPVLVSESVEEGVISRGFTLFILARSGVDYFGAAGVEFFEKFQLSASSFARRSAAAASDLTYVRHTAPIFVPAYDDTDPRPRYRADLFFYTQIDYTETDQEVTEMTAIVELVKPDDTKMTGEITVQNDEE